jgi:nucleotide-binding universal stress UspA family protein
MYNQILIPLDGSELAEMALPHAESLALKYDATLVLLSIVTPPVITSRGAKAMELFEAQIDTLMEEAAGYLDTLKEKFAEKQIKAKTFTKLGPVVKSILEFADNDNVDLVLIASHGRSGLGRFFYGRVAAGILNRVGQPLMVIRCKDCPE